MQTDSIDRAFWNNRRVLVTGHTGFMGGWLCLWLTVLGARVAGYSLAPPTRPNFFEATGLEDRMCSMIGDIRQGNKLSQAMTEFSPDVVIHLAAQPLVGQAYEAPAETFSVNVQGTVNLLQAIRTTESVRTALIVTTDKVYEDNNGKAGYRESDRLGGQEPYGASKACCELAVDAFRHSYFDDRGLGIATIRAGNIVGGGDWAANRLVPDAIRAFSSGRPFSIRNPDAVRPWQHVLDPLCGYLILAQVLSKEPATYSGPWNFGPAEADAATVGMVADHLARLWGEGALWSHDGGTLRGGAKEAKLLRLSSDKAFTQLGWTPRWGLERALSASVDWYRNFLKRQDMGAFSIQQIALAEGAN